jgi:hypothetical protein
MGQGERMSLTDRQYQGTVLLRNIVWTFTNDELDSFIAQEGDVKLAQAAAYEVEASSVMFPFGAGDVSADKSRYAANLLSAAKQIRADHVAFTSELSSMVSWSGSADFGTAEVETWIDADDREPTF